MENDLMPNEMDNVQKYESTYSTDNVYIEKCRKRLREWGAPLEGWVCTDMIDNKTADFKCELCDCNKVRYIHTMDNALYFEPIYVGCICAGIMEDNVIAAKERERLIRNREKRRKHFPYRKWNKNYDGSVYVNYQGSLVTIYKNGSYYSCNCNGKWIYRYKGKGISDFTTAALAAFDAADPFSEAWK